MRDMINKISHEDLISKLPDHILVHILSFLPTRDAIKTVLLRRFGNLWRSVSVIDLNECSHHPPASDYDGGHVCYEYFNWFPSHAIIFSRVIDHVSNLHNVGVVDKLSLKFRFGACNFSNKDMINVNGFEFSDSAQWDKATASRIQKLVSYTINRKVKILDLDFRGCSDVDLSEQYQIMPVFFTSNCLTNMSLVCCDISLRRETINLTALKVLLLDEVVLSDDVMKNILMGCPMLADLSLIICYGLSKLCCNKNPNLKKLRVNLYPSHEETLDLSCRYVTSLEIHNWLVGATLLDVNSSLFHATISFESFFNFISEVYDGIQKLLHQISHCKTITLCGFTILMLTIWNFRNMPCASYQWKNLTVKLEITKWHYPGLSWLLKSCQLAETLTIYIDSNEYYRLLQSASEIIAHEFDVESYWDSQEARLHNLECIIIHGCVNKPNLDAMLKFLLRSATNLQKMVISIKEENKECCSTRVVKLRHELSAFPRASPQATIHVSC